MADPKAAVALRVSGGDANTFVLSFLTSSANRAAFDCFFVGDWRRERRDLLLGGVDPLVSANNYG